MTDYIKTDDGLRPISDEKRAEIAPVSVSPRVVSPDDFFAALTDEEAATMKPRDLLRIAACGAVPITKGAVKRIADKLGTTPDAFFDKIEGE